MKRPMKLEIYRESHYCQPRGCVDNAWRWRIRATNGRILADSGEAYGRLRDCAHGAHLASGLNLAEVAPGDDWRTERQVLKAFDEIVWQPWRIVVDA